MLLPLIDFARRQIVPTPTQEAALEAIGNFLQSKQRCFLLKGYAGTGKTFLTRIIAKYISYMNIPLALMAPTGRAARVLTDKTGFEATTIHKAIYNLDHLDEIELRQNGKVKYKFKYLIEEIKTLRGGVIIIDEASMISDRISEHDFFVFGSGRLLADLIEFAQLKHIDSSTRIIFVGDPAQLPPVGDSVSGALSSHYLADNYEIEAAQFELTHVVRQSEKSEVLALATKIREMMSAQVRNIFQIEGGNEVMKTDVADVSRLFLQTNPELSYHKSVIINYSNRAALDFNLDVRRQCFGDPYQIEPGDTLMIVQNNYNYQVELFNGTMVKVLEVDPNPEIKAGMLSYGPNGDECRVTCKFRRVTIEAPKNNKEMVNISCLILEDFLYSPVASPTYAQHVALYLDFKIRNPHLKPKTKPFTDALRQDVYFNALRVKYGYSVTCHKAQGGEWEEIFLNLDVGIGTLTQPFLRWVYTAVTRASKRLYVFNIPEKNQFTGLNYAHLLLPNENNPAATGQPIVIKSTVGYDSLVEKLNLSGAQKFRKDKLFEIWAIARENKYDITRHTSETWCDIYEFAKNGDHAGLKFWFNGKNQFTRIEMFVPWTTNPAMAGELAILFGKPAIIQIATGGFTSEDDTSGSDANYADADNNPYFIDGQHDQLKILYNTLLPLLASRNIDVKKIIHQQYTEKYYFGRMAETAQINFWYNADYCFTYAKPELASCNSNNLLNDLNEIINQLKTGSHEQY